MAEPTHPPADAATAATWQALRDHTAPPAFTVAVADLLLGAVDPARPVVDVGTGSGHLVAAIARRGALVVATDLSLPMLDRVPSPLRRVAADAVRLPFRDAAAGAALAAHVLHVVPDWRRAVAELDRVVGPDGVVLVQAGPRTGGSGRQAELRNVFRDNLPAAALAGSELAGPGGDDVLAATFAELGRECSDLPVVEVPRLETARGIIRWMQGNPWSWPGPSSDGERAAAAAAARAWAASEGIDLDEPFETSAVNRWRAFRAWSSGGGPGTGGGTAGGPG